MRNSKPEISVIMGAYNGAKDLPATLDSILRQTGVDLELIVIDDGSTDSTPAILHEYAAQDSRVRVHGQDNQGLTRALIKACSLARSEVIARHDVGDISLPTRLSRQLALLRSDPSLVLTYCAYDLVGPEDELLVEGCTRNSTANIVNSLWRLDPRTIQSPGHPTVMFRKQAYEAVGGYRPEFYFAQDVDLFVRMITVGNFAGVEDSLYRLRFAFGSLSAVNNQRQYRLRTFIAEAEQRRRQGRPYDSILATAGTVRPVRSESSRLTTARTAYFLGSNLLSRNDQRANGYFLQAIRANPLHWKAWIKLLSAGLSGLGTTGNPP